MMDNMMNMMGGMGWGMGLITATSSLGCPSCYCYCSTAYGIIGERMDYSALSNLTAATLANHAF